MDKLQSSVATDLFKQKTQEALAKLTGVEELREDVMINFVFKTGKELFATPLDQQGVGWLISKGGKLAGAYVYLSNISSRARAERDVYAQKRDEVLNELTAEYYPEASKITLARTRAKQATAELDEWVILKGADMRNLERVMSACSTMIMFIQSSIKVKQSEMLVSRQIHDSN